MHHHFILPRRSLSIEGFHSRREDVLPPGRDMALDPHTR
jgi:hypothetical protein